MNKLILIGGFIEIVELCEANKCEITGIVDKAAISGKYEYLGTDEQIAEICKKYSQIPLVVTPDIPGLRFKIYNNILSQVKVDFYTLVSKKALISPSSKIGEGTVVQSGCNVSSNVEIGKMVKLNTLCNIMHDSIIGDFSTVAPNAVILGRVKIGKMSYIGANSTILPNIEIGNNVIVGAGSVVTKNIPDNVVFAGNPAKYLKENI